MKIIPAKIRPLVSVCIPTYNRAKLLDDCLNRIYLQLTDKKIKSETEIIVSNNNSSDNTDAVVKKYLDRYANIRYFKNKKNLGGDANILKSAGYARGKYIWFFPDDDLQYRDALKKIFKVISDYSPDSININLDLVDKEGKKIDSKNLLNLERDRMIVSKKNLFKFLETKFFFPFEWYVTCMTSTIVRRSLFRKNINKVKKLCDFSTSNFPHTGIIYYDPTDIKMYFIAKPLAMFRRDNRSFGPDEIRQKKKYLKFIYHTFKKHYDLILEINKANISFRFRLLLYLKNLLRQIRILITPD